MRVEYIITGNPQREERFDYPLEAIREIVINMVVHRDYRDSGDSIIKIFDNRIEFFNPGKLYDDLTIEKLLSGNYSSRSRNRAIAKIFKEAGIIEKYGSSIARIRKKCKHHQVKEPVFEEFQHGFRVTLFKEKLNNETYEGINCSVNGSVNQLLNIISGNPGLKTKDLSILTETPLRTIESWLKQLKDEDKIEFKGSPKTGGYYIK